MSKKIEKERAEMLKTLNEGGYSESFKEHILQKYDLILEEEAFRKKMNILNIVGIIFIAVWLAYATVALIERDIARVKELSEIYISGNDPD